MEVYFRKKPKLLGNYINGNYQVSIYEDGTRIKETTNKNDTQFIADFPDSCDMKITNNCDMNCPMCFTAGTKILMSDFTTKNIEDIQIGDEILGFDEMVEKNGKGRKLYPVRVTKTFVHVEDSLLKVITENNNEIISTPNHPFLATKNINSSRRNILEFYKLEQLTTKSALCCAPFSLENIDYNSNQYKIGYLVGAWCGDGSITKGIDKKGYDYYASRFVTLNEDCNRQVYDFLQVFCEYFYKNDFNLKTLKGENRVRTSVRSSSKAAFDFLTNLINENILSNNTREYCAGYLAGFYDTEGHIDKQRKTIRVCNTNKKFLDEWKRCLEKFNFSYIDEKPRWEKMSTKEIFTVRFRGNNEKNTTPTFKWAKLLQIIRPIYDYKNLESNLLENKMYIKEKIKKITPIINKQYVYNLETTSHTYVANNFYVHNCHEASSTDGKHAAQLLSHPIISNLHPYTELAIGGGNPLSHPQLLDFLKLLKEKKVIANITLNYKHFIDNLSILQKLVSNNLIRGIGISSNDIDDNLIYILEHYPNIVLHVINGLITPENLQKLYGKRVRVLILGYKKIRRGKTLYDNNKDFIDNNKRWMYNNVADFITKLRLVSFDELALNQLDVKRAIPEEKWNLYYQGGDGQSTMFVDLVQGKFAKSSISNKRYSLNNIKCLDEALHIIQKEGNGK